MWADVVRAVTGCDYRGDRLGGYRTAAGALRRLRRAGWASVLHLVEATFEEIPPAQAVRGDLVLAGAIDGPLTSPAVLTGHAAVSKSFEGLVTVPVLWVTRAFAV